MSVTQKIKDYFASEGQVIRSAPAGYVAAVAGAAVVIWFVMNWTYGGIIANRDGIIGNRDSTIANKDSEISLLTKQLDSYKDAFKNNGRAATTENPNNNSAIIKQLVELVNKGEQIQQTFLEKNDLALIKQQTTDWYTETNNLLNEKLDASYSVAFRNSPNAVVMPLNHSMEGGSYWQVVEGKKAALISIVTELRRK
ncbi:MAG TPA: hypothetical protein VFC45_08215 [Pseudolabrys sp.]|nr:hypothetical protein [Pseudolabrys sp.]